MLKIAEPPNGGTRVPQLPLISNETLCYQKIVFYYIKPSRAWSYSSLVLSLLIMKSLLPMYNNYQNMYICCLSHYVLLLFVIMTAIQKKKNFFVFFTATYGQKKIKKF